MLYLARSDPEEVYLKSGKLLELTFDTGGFALGSGNSIPDYVLVSYYRAIIRAADDFIVQVFAVPLLFLRYFRKRSTAKMTNCPAPASSNNSAHGLFSGPKGNRYAPIKTQTTPTTRKLQNLTFAKVFIVKIFGLTSGFFSRTDTGYCESCDQFGRCDDSNYFS